MTAVTSSIWMDSTLPHTVEKQRIRESPQNLSKKLPSPNTPTSPTPDVRNGDGDGRNQQLLPVDLIQKRQLRNEERRGEGRGADAACGRAVAALGDVH